MARRGFLDLDVPFFLPAWRRIAVIVVMVGWGAFEIAKGEAFWGFLFIAGACIVQWKFSTTDWAEVAAREEDNSTG